MAGFSFGGMQTLNIGLCAHLKEFAWFAGLDAAGNCTPNADDIAKYVAMQNPQMYPLYYFYMSAGPTTAARDALEAAANGLTTKGPYITTANFSSQENITGQATAGTSIRPPSWALQLPAYGVRAHQLIAITS